MDAKEEGKVDMDAKDPEMSAELATLVSEKKAKVDLTTTNYKSVVYEVGKAVLKEYGGPQQYLQAKVQENYADFASFLDTAYPLRMDVKYATSIPNNTTEKACVHLKDLGFSKDKSTKPAPFLDASIPLLDEIITNGFVSEHDPLLVWDGAGGRPDEQPFWLYWVKGALRSSTVLFLAALCPEKGWDLSAVAPGLSSSMACIYIRRSTLATDLAAIALENAQLSARGNIRRAHCAVTWLSKLRLLRSKNLSPSEVLNSWNSMSTRDSQIQGSKRQALMCLLEFPDEVATRLLQHVSTCGPQATFTDEVWSSKKLQIGYCPRGSSKDWNSRLTITGPAVTLMVEALCHQQEERLKETRRKKTKEEIEDTAQKAQFVLWLKQATMETGVPAEKINYEQAFRDGDHHFMLELTSALTEKSAKFNFAELTVVQAVMKQHKSESSNALAPEAHARQIAAANLEKEEMDLLLKSVQSPSCT